MRGIIFDIKDGPEGGDYIIHIKGKTATFVFDEPIIRCGDCFYWQAGCCTKYGKQAHPARWADDFCSRGVRRDENEWRPACRGVRRDEND